MNDTYDTLMGFKPEEVRLFYFGGGAGRKGVLRITHIPSGKSVYEELAEDSTDVLILARDRLLNRLKTEIDL